MKLSTIQFLGVAMLIVNTFAAPLSEEMHTRGERNAIHTRGENEMQAREDVGCLGNWSSVDNFPKCYFYSFFEDGKDFEEANNFCATAGARLFTPASLEEMQSVPETLFSPEFQNSTKASFFTSYVQFNWQQWKDPEPMVFASNAFPFEAVPDELWDAGEPGDWTPSLMEPCSFSVTGTAKDWNYDDYQWYHKLRLHDVLCDSKWNTVICETATGENMMQNRQERAGGKMMQNRSGGDEEERR